MRRVFKNLMVSPAGNGLFRLFSFGSLQRKRRSHRHLHRRSRLSNSPLDFLRNADGKSALRPAFWTAAASEARRRFRVASPDGNEKPRRRRALPVVKNTLKRRFVI